MPIVLSFGISLVEKDFFRFISICSVPPLGGQLLSSLVWDWNCPCVQDVRKLGLSSILFDDFSVVRRGFEAACLNGDFEVFFLPLLCTLGRVFFEAAAASCAFIFWIYFFYSISKLATSLFFLSCFRPPFILKSALSLFAFGFDVSKRG